MNIKPFKVEEWMNEYEDGAKYNIAETCVDSVSVEELFNLAGENLTDFWGEFSRKRLTYGAIFGREDFKAGIRSLYSTLGDDEIVVTHGAAGANHHVFYSLVNPGDKVVSIMPTYQQLYSIPESYGAEMTVIRLEEKNGYLPDLSQLKAAVTAGTKLICINNPNNPTGALMSENLLLDIIDIARSVGAYILCDEVYRHLTQEEVLIPSIVDLYEKGISVSSMSKVFSLAGLRLGWIASHDREFIRACLSHRDYNLISCGMFDEAVAAVALKNADKLMERNRAMVRNNLDILDNWLASEPRLHYVKPQAGTTALVYYEYDLPSYEFCRRMYEESGAFVTPGDCFEEPKSMRIGYACAPEVLREGLAAMSIYLRTLESEGK